MSEQDDVIHCRLNGLISVEGNGVDEHPSGFSEIRSELRELKVHSLSWLAQFGVSQLSELEIRSLPAAHRMSA